MTSLPLAFPRRQAARALAGAALLAFLAGCEVPPGGTASGPAPASAPVPTETPDSAAARAYYARLQGDLLAQGLMRTDGGGPDTPFNARNLAENFIRVALYDEYAGSGGGFVARQTPSRLRRWVAPVRMTLEFGDAVPEDERAKDRAWVGAYAARLGRLSGHPTALVQGSGNFRIFVLTEDERRAFGPKLRAMMPGIDETAVRTIETMPRSTYCLVFAFSEGSESTYVDAVAVIRAEHPDLLRLSCYHEELAQGMGLANDSPVALPSIFNDDEEFALLTRQDELMLKMLYDQRLKIGMTPDEARPIVETLAKELLGGEG